jgi:hypothetical protein
MFIRQTRTGNKATGEGYVTYRLVRSERIGGKVRQITLLNLGRHFPIKQEDWPILCSRLEQLVNHTQALIMSLWNALESCRARSAALLCATGCPRTGHRVGDGGYGRIDQRTSPACGLPGSRCGLPADDATPVGGASNTSVCMRPASWGLIETLNDLGVNGVVQASILGNLIGRMGQPGSELATWNWLQRHSALGELLDVDFLSMSHMCLYRASDVLMKHREVIETRLFSTARTLFDLPETVTLYDLTNTYFEGEAKLESQGQAGAFEGEAQRLTAGDARSGARRQRLRPALTDLRRQRFRARHAGVDAGRTGDTGGSAGGDGCRHCHRRQRRLAG